MSMAVITGAGGLIGSGAALYFARSGLDVVGIDNDMGKYFFGEEAPMSYGSGAVACAMSLRDHGMFDVRDRTSSVASSS